jgi:alpha/beta superfamily hydrolase
MTKAIFFIAALISVNFLLAQQNKTIATEKIVSIISKGVAIEGSLLSASTAQKLVIIIAGSGPTDRNGNSIAGINCNTYKQLAEELSKNNIASFRYDKRGIGKSSVKDFNEKNLLFDDYVSDAIAIYNYLKDSSGFKKIYFAGHSEGSLIGMIASERTKANGYISIAGAGRPINVIITEQITKQSPVIGRQTDSLLTVLKTKNKIDSVPPYLLSLLRPSIQPYMISWMKYDPQLEIKNVPCSILILQGTCDIQVKTLDAQDLYDANKKAKLDIIEGMTHVLKNAEANCIDKNLNTYHDPSLPLNTQLVKDIVSFIELN